MSEAKIVADSMKWHGFHRFFEKTEILLCDVTDAGRTSHFVCLNPGVVEEALT